MFKRLAPSLRIALLAGLVIGAIATQLEPTETPNIRAFPSDKTQAQVAITEKTRRAHSTPAALTKAIASAERDLYSGSRSLTPGELSQITDTRPDFGNASARVSRSDPDKMTRWVRVSGSVVNVRSGPRASARRIGSFMEGTRLRVIERGKSWTKIENPETGQSGWMYRGYLVGMSEDGEPAT